MHHPAIWPKVPLDFQPIDFRTTTILEIEAAKKEKEIELMYDFDGHLWWRRDLNETYELGL